MKRKRQKQEPELNITPASAAPIEQAELEEPVYTLEQIMDEFGGWSKREKDAEDAAPVAAGEAAPVSAAEETAPEAETSEAPPDEHAEAAQKEDETPRIWPPAPQNEQSGKAPAPRANLTADTIRFAPVAPPEKEEPPVKIWSYKGEAEPAADVPRTKKNRADKRASAQQRRLARFQKKEQRRLKRQEKPDVVYPSAEDAYKAYSGRSNLRLRLALSVLVCLLSVALCVLASTPIGALDLTRHAQLLDIALLAMLLVSCLLAADVLLIGLQQCLQLKMQGEGLLLLTALVTLVDTFFALSSQRVPFCTVVCLELMAALWGRTSLLDAKRRTMKAVCSMSAPVAASREEKAWHGRDCIFRTAADRDAFAVKLEMPDATRRVMRIYAPVLAAGTLAAAVLTTLQSGRSFTWAWSAMLLAGYPTGVLIAYGRPFRAHAKRLIRAGSALAGWYGARLMSGEAGVIVRDTDLFPTQNVTLNGMKLYSDRPASQIIGFGAAVVESAGSGLEPLFEEMMHSQNGRRYAVDTFHRYEGGGLGAEIRGDVVLMGSLAFMKLMKVRMPDGARLKQAVYLSVNGDLAAVFALTYDPAAAVRSSLLAATRTNGLLPILATRDFMITPQFIKHRYKISPDRIEFPTVEERARLSDPDAGKTGKQGALMAKGGFSSFIACVVGARSLHATTVASTAISLAGGLFGALIVCFLALIGSVQAASALNVLLLSLLWLFPDVLITSLTGRS